MVFLSLFVSVLGCGREEAEHQSSSLVSGRCSCSFRYSCQRRTHQPSQCKKTHYSCLIGFFSSLIYLCGENLQEKKNSIELFVSADRLGISEPRPAEEVIQSLNARILHRHLGHFGITEVSTEVCILSWSPRQWQCGSPHGDRRRGWIGTIRVQSASVETLIGRLKIHRSV